MCEYVVNLPLRDNAGVKLDKERKAIERELLALAGGYTVQAVRGAWLDGGKVYRDAGRLYTVACDAATLARLQARVPAWCALTRQLALYTAVRECAVVIVAA